MTDPVVIKHAAFEVSPAAYDEITRRLRNRGYHHLFDAEQGCIFMQYIALTRALEGEPEPYVAAWILENGLSGAEHRYIRIDKKDGNIGICEGLSDDVPRFARKEDADSFAKLVDYYFMTNQHWTATPHVWG